MSNELAQISEILFKAGIKTNALIENKEIKKSKKFTELGGVELKQVSDRLDELANSTDVVERTFKFPRYIVFIQHDTPEKNIEQVFANQDDMFGPMKPPTRLLQNLRGDWCNIYDKSIEVFGKLTTEQIESHQFRKVQSRILSVYPDHMVVFGQGSRRTRAS